MKVVINKCYGGFSLSYKGIKRLTELQGRKFYAFTSTMKTKYKPYEYDPNKEVRGLEMVAYFDIPNPNDLFDEKGWAKKSKAEQQKYNDLFNKHYISNRPDDRADPLLVQVVEELGEEANGSFADLKVVEIPDGTEYTIEEYDGIEHIAQVHNTWG